jgi:nitronate monooxygenase
MQRLGIDRPILVAPMAGAAGPDLAIAAMKAGALGSLPCALLTPEQISEQVAQVRAATHGPINLNFFCHDMPDEDDDTVWRAILAPYYAEYHVGPRASPPPLRLPFSDASCEAVEALRPEVVSFHFGLPGPALLARVKATGAILLASATTPREAIWLADQGVDAVIAQGAEAGGHASSFLDGGPETQMGLFALVPQIVDAIDLPVIAAGGIMDARGIAAALLLGASAVQMGTAFLHTTESRISPMHRAALTSPDAEQTQFTTLFSGRAARGIPNRLMRELGAMNPGAPLFPHASAALSPLRAKAEAAGDPTFSSLWAGQASRLGRAMGAGALIETLMMDTQQLLATAQAASKGWNGNA